MEGLQQAEGLWIVFLEMGQISSHPTSASIMNSLEQGDLEHLLILGNVETEGRKFFGPLNLSLVLVSVP